MFEELIAQLDQMGVTYQENMEDGSLTVNVADIDKVTLISVIQLANDSGLEFMVDEASLTIYGGEPVMEEPLEEEPMDAQAAALEEFM